MHPRAVLLLLSACGRLSFDPRTDGGAQPILDDTLPIDGITASAPCDTPTLLGTTDFARSVAIGASANRYAIAWVDTLQRGRVILVERSGDTITTSTVIVPSDLNIPVPLGIDVAINNAGVAVVGYWDDSSALLRQLPSPGLGGLLQSGVTLPLNDLAALDANILTLSAGTSLTYTELQPVTLGTSGFTTVTSTGYGESGISAAPALGTFVIAQRPNGNDCTIWSFDQSRLERGFTRVPTDTSQCRGAATSYAPASDSSMLVYEHVVNSESWLQLLLLDAGAQPVGGMMDMRGSDPHIASSGAWHHVLYTPPGVTHHYLYSTPVSFIGTTAVIGETTTTNIDAAIASGVGEVVVTWIVDGVEDQIWLRRICAP